MHLIFQIHHQKGLQIFSENREHKVLSVFEGKWTLVVLLSQVILVCIIPAREQWVYGKTWQIYTQVSKKTYILIKLVG